MTGRPNRVLSATRSRVCWKVDRSPSSGTNCLGMLSRDSGQSRLPEPPTRMMGVISDIPIPLKPDLKPDGGRPYWLGDIADGSRKANGRAWQPFSSICGRGGTAGFVFLSPAAGFLLDGRHQRGDVRGDFVEVAGVEDEQGGRKRRDDGGAARQTVEQGHLAEEAALAEPYRVARQPHLDLALGEEEHRIAGFVAAHDHDPRRVMTDAKLAHDLGQGDRAEF